MTIRPDIELSNASDVGCVRSANEDYYLFIEPQSDEEFARRGRLVLIADGMGGYTGGRIASRLAGDTLRDTFLASDASDPLDVLQQGFLLADSAIRDQGTADPELSHMGTTCTAVVLRERHLWLGHIGDSRLYLIREGQAQQVTRDHTVVNDLLDQGLITPEQAETHEKKHVLSAALGGGMVSSANFVKDPVDLQPGDILLLCSDGLHGLVSAGEMVSVTVDQSLDEACAELVAWARVRGGPDNITLQMIRIVTPGSVS